mgnify:CR=1 FL=1
MKWTINHLEDLNKVAAEFLDYVGDKTIFALYGPMGVGKSTFVRAVAACLGVTDDVSSPTFALVNEYQTKNGKSLYHFDFYRLCEAEELREIGFMEYLQPDAVVVVEWAELFPEVLPQRTLSVRINYQKENEMGRELLIRGEEILLRE